MTESCGNCRRFEPVDPSVTRPAGVIPDAEGRCGFKRREGFQQWVKRRNWCDQWKAQEQESQ